MCKTFFLALSPISHLTGFSQSAINLSLLTPSNFQKFQEIVKKAYGNKALKKMQT
jgi:hypothetical protein